MKTIIIPTDFSPGASNAMHYGIQMAQAINASVLLFHAYQVPVSIADTPIVLVSLEDLEKNAEEQMSVLRKEVAHICSDKTKIYSETKLGDITDELEELCNKTQPFAVVMGTKGSSAAERVFFGSNTLTAIRHLVWPVICVPPGKQFGNGIKKIGFACDFRHVVETTPTHFIKEIIREFNAELHVLNVDHNNKHFKPETPEESLLLHTLFEDVKPSYHFIEHKEIEDGINDFTQKNNIDLLIAIPKKHKLLESLFKPSATKQLVIHSHIPVMCIHED